MSARDCRLADLWMAEVDTGQLDEASRIRLLDHLESCPACARRARGITRLVSLLREEPVMLREERLRQSWERIVAATPAPAIHPRRSSRRAWQLGMVAGAAAILLVVGWLWRRAPPPVTSVPARAVASAKETWRVIFLLEAAITRSALAADRLEVGKGGRAVLASSREVLIVRGGSELSFANAADGTPRLELFRGALSARTLTPGAGSGLLVQAGPVTVRPLGTAFSVVRNSEGVFEAAVLDGRVEVRGGGSRVVVVAGNALRWGSAPRPLERGERHELEEDLLQAAQALASPRPVSVTVPPELPAAPRPSTEIEAEIRAIERLLARGHSTRARAWAVRLLEHGQAQGRASTLRTLVAESFLRERRYREARDSYLLVWKHFARSPLGADGLYMVGSLELEQLGEPALARRRFEHYLASQPGGRQREGAYYLLCRALLELGATDLARARATRYLAEFPRGQLRSTLERIASTPNRR